MLKVQQIPLTYICIFKTFKIQLYQYLVTDKKNSLIYSVR